MARSAGAVEYAECFSAEWVDMTPDEMKSDGEAPLMQIFGGMQSTTLLLSLPGPLWPRVEALDRVPSIGQLEVLDIKTVLILNWIVLNTTFLTFKLRIYAKPNCLK